MCSLDSLKLSAQRQWRIFNASNLSAKCLRERVERSVAFFNMHIA
jgi:hypothetical protein